MSIFLIAKLNKILRENTKLKNELHSAHLKIQDLTFEIKYGRYERAKNIIKAYEQGTDISADELDIGE